MTEIRLLLASSSPYRRQLLERLQLPFTADNPAIDESALPNESAKALVQRLSIAKAQALIKKYPDSLVIGSDQVAVLDGRILGKPETHQRAFTQLKQCQNRAVDFHTGLCLLNAASGQYQVDCVPFTVYFRELSDGQITRYLNQEKPYDSAGSFKAESLGICLFKRMQGDDPTALLGLPLIRLTSMLLAAGVELPR